jgi:hypothetical protein
MKRGKKTKGRGRGRADRATYVAAKRRGVKLM